MSNEDGLKILSAEIENFKNIQQKDIKLDGRSVRIIGGNGEGKSSLIQALLSVTGSKWIPDEPVSKGEERGHVEVTIGGKEHGEDVTYKLGVWFSKKGRVIIEDGEGNNIGKSKSVVNEIIGNFGFDIMEFLSMARTDTGKASKAGIQKQIKALEDLMPLELREKLFNIDNELKDKAELKTELNLKLKGVKSQIADFNMSDEDREKYMEPIDEDAIVKRLGSVSEEIQKYDDVAKEVNQMERDLPSLELAVNSIGSLDKKIDSINDIKNELENDNSQETRTLVVHAASYLSYLKKHLTQGIDAKPVIPTYKEKIQKGTAWLEKKQRPSLESIQKELEEARIHNRTHESVKDAAGLHTKLADVQKEIDALDDSVKKLKTSKTEVFATEGALPVAGLAFDEDQITYKGLPFVEGQQPSSTLIGVGVNIAMAMNPNLKVIVIKDGSLLDKKMYKYILGLVEKKGYQLLMEQVKWDGGDYELVFEEEEV